MSDIRPRLLMSVTRTEDGKRLEELLSGHGAPITYQCRGKGTAPSELLDIFGLSGTTRLVTIALTTKDRIKDIFHDMGERLSFRQKGGGVAVSLPVSNMQSGVMELLKEEESGENMTEASKKPRHYVIWASVGVGYSDEVVDAARQAGAKGGSILRGRRSAAEKTHLHLGIAMQEEQDFVMIIVPEEKKKTVMSAISGACGLGSQARGIVFSMPVDEALGLE